MMRSILCGLLLAVSSTAFADDLNYNFLTLGYDRVDLDDDLGFDVDGDSWNIGGSFEVGESWFLFAGYGMGDFDFGIDLDQWSAGGGYHLPMADNVDFVATLSYQRADISAGSLSLDDDGFGASVGIRAMVSERVELNGAVNYVDFGDFGDNTSLSGSAWLNLTEQFALGLGVSFGDDATAYGLGGRLYFGL